MDTQKRGAALHGEDAEARRLAASLLGSARTPRKTASSRANVARAVEARRGRPISEEYRAKLREAQRARREREKQERQAAAGGLAEAPEREPAAPVSGQEKRPVGRPRTRAQKTDAPKRPVGRPKKTQEAPSA